MYNKISLNITEFQLRASHINIWYKKYYIKSAVYFLLLIWKCQTQFYIFQIIKYCTKDTTSQKKLYDLIKFFFLFDFFSTRGFVIKQNLISYNCFAWIIIFTALLRVVIFVKVICVKSIFWRKKKTKSRRNFVVIAKSNNI